MLAQHHSQNHQTFIKIRSYHVDLFKHVNNARYLEFLEEARWSYFEQHHLMSLLNNGENGIVVVNINIDYRQAAKINDTIIIETHFHSIRNRSAIISQTIKRPSEDKIIVSAKTTLVVIQLANNQVISFNDQIKLKIKSLIIE